MEIILCSETTDSTTNTIVVVVVYKYHTNIIIRVIVRNVYPRKVKSHKASVDGEITLEC